jgi:hypothetical protein
MRVRIPVEQTRWILHESTLLVAKFQLEPYAREATRELQVEIRSFELDSDNDAGVMGSY